jgi:hypothetical protein
MTEIVKELRFDAAGAGAWVILSTCFDHDVDLQDLTLEPSLLDKFTIGSVSYSHRLMTDDELRKVKKLRQISGYFCDEPGPKANAQEGAHRFINASKAHPWTMPEDEADPVGACKRAFPNGRLDFEGGRCINGTLVTLQIKNITNEPQAFVAKITARPARPAP